MHLKRSNVPKFWTVARKGTKFLARPLHNQNDSVPLVVAMRDMLGLVRNKKELKRALNEKQIKINNKIVRETNYPVGLFDVIGLETQKKNYKAVLSKNKKMIFEEVSDKDSKIKIFKVINRKVLGLKKVQINLMHGKNILSDEKVKVGDSVVLNLEENKIVKTIPVEKGRKSIVMKGKHAGKSGKIEDIVNRGGKEIAKIIVDGNKINVWTKNLIAVE